MERYRDNDADRDKSHPRDRDAISGETFRRRSRFDERQLAASA